MKTEIEKEFHQSGKLLFADEVAKYLTGGATRTPWEWAMQDRRIGRGASPLSQHEDVPYSRHVFPWCEEPTNSAVDHDVTHTVLMFGAALGKTDGIVTNIIGWGIVESPTNIMSAFPIEMQRDKYSRDVIQAGLIDATPSIRDRITEKRSRDTGNTMSYKRFPGGSLNMVAAGSVHSFRGPRVGIAHAAEVDGMGASVGSEGDPVELLFKRCEGFENAVKIIEGTCTLAPTTDKNGKKIYRSRIQFWYERSDQRKWHCPCRDCGHFQVWLWKDVRWPKGHSAKGMLHCEKCDAGHNDKQRRTSVKSGKWISTAPFTGIRGYWLNGINSLLPAEKGFKNKIHQFIEDAERAANGMDPAFSMRVWRNTFLSEVDNPEGETEAQPEWRTLHDRREEFRRDGKVIVPEWALVLTAAVDCQINRLEVNWQAWGRDEKCANLSHVVLDGNIRDQEVWKDLSREFARTWEHELGCDINLSLAFIDGGWAADWVYAYLQGLARHPVPGVTGKVRASKGIGKHGHPIIDPKWRTVAKQLKGYHVGTWEAKDTINQRLRMVPNEDGSTPHGYIRFERDYSEEFFQQLCSGKVSITYERGEEIRKYLNEEHLKDEALDLNVYNLAAFRLRRWNFDAIEAGLREQAALRAGEAVVVRQKNKTKARRSSDFVGKWR